MWTSFAIFLAVFGAAVPALVEAQVAALISRNSAGQPADSHSYSPAISGDGQVVAFESWASNLVAGVAVENNGVFVRDVLAGRTELVSRTVTGSVPNAKSYRPAISSDGRWVAFWSQASNLVAGDTNSSEDVFLYDRDTTNVQRVTLSSAGAQSDGADGTAHIVTTAPSVSGDGRYVTFDSRSANLVVGDGNTRTDVFVRDLLTGTTECVSLTTDGADPNGGGDSPAISSDGRWVAFRSQFALTADDVGSGFDVYLFDRIDRVLTRVGPTFAGPPAIDADGSVVAFDSLALDLVPNDTNGERDVFTWERLSRVVTRVSVGSEGGQGDGPSDAPALSGDGRYVAYRSHAENLVAGDSNELPDVFLHDRQAGTTRRLSGQYEEADNFSGHPTVDAAGFFVAFESAATNLTFDDVHGAQDIFLAVREDACPGDFKLYAGLCGCGTSDVDTDDDGVVDCHDACSTDATKVAPGACGCGRPDHDTDGVGALDCDEACPTDAAKRAPGPCGCGHGEDDGDHDGTPDCRDPRSVRELRTLLTTVSDLLWRASGRGPEQADLVSELKAAAIWFGALGNNVELPKKVRGTSATVARALLALPAPSDRRFTRRWTQAQKRLAKLLRAIG
jgi:Tol biopolymer transport system component